MRQEIRNKSDVDNSQFDALHVSAHSCNQTKLAEISCRVVSFGVPNVPGKLLNILFSTRLTIRLIRGLQ